MILGEGSEKNSENIPISERGDPIENRFDKTLNSKETLEIINTFPEGERDKAIGEIIQYLIIFPNSNEVNSYLEDLRGAINSNGIGSYRYHIEKSKIISEEMARDMRIKDISGNKEKDFIVNSVVNNFYKNGYYFHSFNGAFEQNIKKNGLSVNERLWDWDDINKLKKIGSRIGEPMLLGWMGINSKGKISISDYSPNIYSYANASPEWFGQFTSEGFHINPGDKKAYYKRDYHNARHNIDLFIGKNSSRRQEDIDSRRAYPNLTEIEKREIIDFFEKYWKCFAAFGPKCALIDRSYIKEDIPWISSYSEFMDKREQGDNTGLSNLENCIDSLLYSFDTDRHINYDIPVENIHIISLPAYTKLH